jgi:hypothetical protein
MPLWTHLSNLLRLRSRRKSSTSITSTRRAITGIGRFKKQWVFKKSTSTTNETAPYTTWILNLLKYSFTISRQRSLRPKILVWVRSFLSLLYLLQMGEPCQPWLPTFLNTTPLFKELKTTQSTWSVDWHRRFKSMITTCFLLVYRLMLIFKSRKRSRWSLVDAVRLLVLSVTDLSLSWAAWLVRTSKQLCAQRLILKQMLGSTLTLYQLHE